MVSTGLKELDTVITGLQLGDNVVWQIDAVADYAYFVRPFVRQSLAAGRRVVYVRFGSHKPVVEASKRVPVYALDAFRGFESFSTELHGIIKREGEGVFYVFDCLSSLLSAWSNDLMIGNFFKITCPYLFQLRTIAYFGLLSNSHSFKTIARIRETTQLLIDVYRKGEDRYIHPLKVWGRHTPTMFLPHINRQDTFVPITNSTDAAQLFAEIFKKSDKSVERKLDYWDRLFLGTGNLARRSAASAWEKSRMADQLCRILIARDEKIVDLAKRYLSLDDLLAVKSRMIGTGFIGGKTAGMLLARSILAREKSWSAATLFEPHDSFYVGSDVFYTYIVENGWWNTRMEQKTKKGYFKVARSLRKKLLDGVFPHEITEQFQRMIEYFGQSPIIVRSSSLLEDSYGSAFAGKYESIFLSNQGSPEERYERFTRAVRRIYASSMNEDALTYRLQRGLDQADEQMALLVQRVSGSYRKNYFFPDVAGVGISYNTFVWTDKMDPEAGMLRVVVGMGTRAVNRVDGDYPRIVALDDPLRRVNSDAADRQKFSQHEIDLINVKTDEFATVPLRQLLRERVDMHLDLVAVKDDAATERLREYGSDEDALVITFDELLAKTDFARLMRKILVVLAEAYRYPVDIEFTLNFGPRNQFKINMLQCRPLQTKGLGGSVRMPARLPEERVIIRTHGNFLGGNISLLLQRIIYVDPQAYAGLATQSARYDIARLIGELNRQIANRGEQAVMLLGPGRWGTSTPSLGVPVTFAEINNIAVLGEIAFREAGVAPELSFGTHFFQDLVESQIFYLAIVPDNADTTFRRKFFRSVPNALPQLVPQYAKYKDVVQVFDITSPMIRLVADVRSQNLLVYRTPTKKS